MAVVRSVAWSRQPSGLPRLRRDHPLGAILDSVWLPQGAGMDHLRGTYAPKPSDVSIAPHQRGLAFTAAGSAGGSRSNLKDTISTYPYVMFAYGYLNNTSANHRLLTLYHVVGAHFAELYLKSGTQLGFRLLGSTAVERSVGVTVSGGVTSNPMLAVGVARSATDYSLYVNGESADGTLDVGTQALTQFYPLGSSLNGGIFAAGYGIGRTLPAGMLLDITRDPRNLWEAFESPRVWVPSGAVSSGLSGAAAITLDGATIAATGTLPLSGAAAITLDGATLAATGTVASTGTLTGDLAVTLAGSSLSAAGDLDIAGAAAITLTGATLSATGTFGNVLTGDAAVTLAGATLSATGAATIAGVVGITLTGSSLSAAGATTIAGAASITLSGSTLSAVGVNAATAETVLGAMVGNYANRGRGRPLNLARGRPFNTGGFDRI